MRGLPGIDCAFRIGGGCALGKFGGRPHVGVCASCLAGAKEPRKSKIRQVYCPDYRRPCCGEPATCGRTGAEVRPRCWDDCGMLQGQQKVVMT